MGSFNVNRARSGWASAAVVAALVAVAACAPDVEPSPSKSASPSASETEEPYSAWSELADDELPPVAERATFAEPESYEMGFFYWGFVDATWAPFVYREFNEDESAMISQVLFLEAPDGALLRLFDMRVDLFVDVAHWDPALRTAWLSRYNTGDGFNTIQLDLVNGIAVVDWLPGLVTPIYGDGEEISGLSYVGERADGTEVWTIEGYRGNPYAVYFRDEGGSFRQSAAIQDAVRPLWDDAYTDGAGDPGGEMWIDLESGRAVYLLQRIDWMASTLALGDAQWILHDLESDTWTSFAPDVGDAVCGVEEDARGVVHGSVRAYCIGTDGERTVVDVPLPDAAGG